MRKLLFLSALCFFIHSGFSQTPNVNSEAKETYADIEKTLGQLPTMFKDYPQEAITGAWENVKNIQYNSKTSLSNKYKELIGVAVAAQIGCKSCVYLHTQGALVNGSSQQEIKEAIAMGASTQRWSTFLSGIQTDEMEFRTEVDRLIAVSKARKNKQAMEERPVILSVKTPQDAFADMEATIGIIPYFMRSYPGPGVVGLWKEIKGLELNPATEIPLRFKQLLGLAVASQIPCRYCTYYHTQQAIFEEASKEELQEAVAMAGITRQWSGIINGQQLDEMKFQTEVDQIMKFLKNRQSRAVSL
jgi:AhpD family alkylhydroperoxidase